MKFKNIEWGMEKEAKGKTPAQFNQVHGTEIFTLPQVFETTPNGDGAITYEKNFEIYVFSADCMPVLFFGEDAEDPIAAIHSGWRGTRDGILSHAVSLLSRVKNLHVWVGPHIKSCCFEVQEDFVQSFTVKGIDPEPFLNESKFDLLSYALGNDLKNIPQQNRHLEDARCTVCSIPILPSYRRSSMTDPRIRSWIKKI